MTSSSLSWPYENSVKQIPCSKKLSLLYVSDPACGEETDIKCRNSFCVKKSARCNGMDDCLDNTDEDGCGKYVLDYSNDPDDSSE